MPASEIQVRKNSRVFAELCAAVLEREDTSWKTDFAHRDCDAIFRTFRPLQEANTVADGFR